MTLSAVLDEMRFAPDISLATALKDYQRQRRRVNLRMTAMTDLTKRLFDPKGAELRWLRNAALRAMDQQTALKQMIGLAGAGFL
jgi:2-polyprenyl-6-methoxyphenol hydroxylase-like FAD-dependent oxidoreductase